MTPAQQSALEALAGRALTAEELAQIDPLLVARNDVAIAAALSVGRVGFQKTEIGIGTIIAVLGAHGSSGGEFLDALVVVGEENRDAHWAMVLLKSGTFDLASPASQLQIAALAQAMPEHAAGLVALAATASRPDPLPLARVSEALNIAEGRMTL